MPAARSLESLERAALVLIDWGTARPRAESGPRLLWGVNAFSAYAAASDAGDRGGLGSFSGVGSLSWPICTPQEARVGSGDMADLIRSRPFSGVLIVTPWEPFSTAPLAAPVSSRSSPKEPSDAGALCGAALCLRGKEDSAPGFGLLSRGVEDLTGFVWMRSTTSEGGRTDDFAGPCVALVSYSGASSPLSTALLWMLFRILVSRSSCMVPSDKGRCSSRINEELVFSEARKGWSFCFYSLLKSSARSLEKGWRIVAIPRSCRFHLFRCSGRPLPTWWSSSGIAWCS